jgi:hypothetical protein
MEDDGSNDVFMIIKKTRWSSDAKRVDTPINHISELLREKTIASSHPTLLICKD